eukprot:1642295-Prymnesium_polylepis.2
MRFYPPVVAVCAEGFSRPHTTSPVTECTLCEFRGARCALNATEGTLTLSDGYWRHTTATLEILRCKHIGASSVADGAWSPCSGGREAGNEGDGYCATGYRGPRCELCNGTGDYFSQFEARCKSCGNIVLHSIVALCACFVIFLAGVVGTQSVQATQCQHLACGSGGGNKLASFIRRGHELYDKAGLRFKIKALIGFYQCMAAIPSVFDVRTPQSMTSHIDFMDFMESISDIGVEVVMLPHSACFGSYQRYARKIRDKRDHSDSAFAPPVARVQALVHRLNVAHYLAGPRRWRLHHAGARSGKQEERHSQGRPLRIRKSNSTHCAARP